MTETKVALGHIFAPMSEMDWEIFGAADEGSYICYPDDYVTLILSPSGAVHEIDADGHQTTWTPEKVS